MRWPWQREQPDEPPALAPGEPAPVAAADRIAPAGWAFLPPLQRTIGSMQLTSDPARFAGALASWSDPSFSGRMSHLVSDQAPPGVIDVDGGGPVPADARYPSGSGEMTLLPPPAPRLRSTPAGYGSPTATVQRVTADGGSPDGGAADGPSLLAAEPTTFPVLHVEASPLQRSDAGPQPSPMTTARSLPDTDLTGPAASDPAIETPTPTPAAEAFWPTLPGESHPPRSADTSTSNGGATYVQIPSTPAVQRNPSGRTENAPLVGHIPRPGKLGLGMPLSFSQATPDAAGATETPPGHLSDPLPSPIQRAAHHLPATPPTHATVVDGADGNAVEDPLPDAPKGTPGLQTQEKLPAGRPAAEAAVPTPSEDESAPLLTDASLPGTLEPEGDGRTVEDGTAPRAGEASPAMPVVSRLGTDVPATAGGHLGRGSEPQEASPLWTADPSPLHEPPEDTLGNYPAPPPGDGVPGGHPDTQPDTQPDTGSLRPPAAQPGAGTHAAEPAAIPLLQRSPSTPSSTSLQHTITDAGPGATASPAEGRAFRAELPLPAQGPGISGSTDDPWESGQAGAGKLDQLPSSLPPTVPAVQRVPALEAARHTRAIFTPKGPVVLQIVPSPGRESSPETWQRLTSLPAVAPHPTRPTSGSAEPLSGMPLGNGNGNGAGNDTDPGDTSGAGFTSGTRPAAPSVAAAMDPVHAVTDVLPESNADVGRVIQRTISVHSSGAGDRDALPSSGDPALMRMVRGSQAQPPSGPRPPVIALQRGGVSVNALPATARSTASPWAPESGFPSSAPGGSHAGPAVQVPGSRPVSSRPLTLGLPAAVPPDGGQGRPVLQRDAEIPARDFVTASTEAPAPPATAPERAEAVAAVPGTDTAPAGQGQPGAAVRGTVAGAAAPGSAAQASPEQLEELAKRLAGPLIRRIKAEMLLDRERRGLRTDVN